GHVHLVLQRTCLAADAYARCARVRIGATRHQHEAGAGFDLGARMQRKLDVVANLDREPAERGVEYLEPVTRLDDAACLLEARQHQLVLPGTPALGADQPGAVSVMTSDIEQEGSRDEMDRMASGKSLRQREKVRM